MTSRQKSVLTLFLLVLLLTSCRHDREAERAIQTFFVFVIQVVSFVLFGISSLVLSILSVSGKNKSLKVVGTILLIVFSLVTLFCFMMIQDINPRRDFIYFAFVVDAVVIGISIYFLAKPQNSTQQINSRQAQVTDEYLDKIIESEEVDEIDELEQL